MALNLGAGILIVRWLSVQEYGYYVIGCLLQMIVAQFSDIGLTNCINALASSNGNRQSEIIKIYNAAWQYRKKLIPIALFLMTIIGILIFHKQTLSTINLLLICLIAASSGLLLSAINMTKASLNASQNVRLLFRIGLIEALFRFCLSFLCLIFSSAELALFINLVSLLFAWLLAKSYIPNADAMFDLGNYSDEVRNFVNPLIISVVYSTIQGNLGIAILGFFGAINFVAQTGALGRLGQLLGFFLLLNQFWVQPHFSQIRSLASFRSSLSKMILVLLTIGAIVMISTYLIPSAWLWILGVGYKSLDLELKLALFSSILAGYYAVFYAVVLAMRATKGQIWYVVLGVSLQVLFLFLFKISTTLDALMLSLLPNLAGLIIQIFIISRYLRASAWVNRG